MQLRVGSFSPTAASQKQHGGSAILAPIFLCVILSRNLKFCGDTRSVRKSESNDIFDRPWA